MLRLLTTCFFASLFLLQQPANAQNVKKNTLGLQNTTWKSYVAEPLSDTMVLRFTTDSTYFGPKNQEPMVSGTYTVSGDTIVTTDVTGQHACLAQTGKYKYTITADTMKFTLIKDTCEGRISIVGTATWQRVK